VGLLNDKVLRQGQWRLGFHYSGSAFNKYMQAMYVACISVFRARRVNPNIFSQDCAPSLHDSSAPCYVVSSGAPRKKCVPSRARDGGALVPENGFFESFTPLAVLCGPVLARRTNPQMFSVTIARLFRGRPAHPRTPPSVERLGKRCGCPCADFGSRPRKT